MEVIGQRVLGVLEEFRFRVDGSYRQRVFGVLEEFRFRVVMGQRVDGGYRLKVVWGCLGLLEEFRFRVVGSYRQRFDGCYRSNG